VFKQILKIVGSRKTSGHIDAIGNSSLQKITDSLLLHIPTHEDVDVNSEDYVDEHGKNGSLFLDHKDFIEMVESGQGFRVLLMNDCSFDRLGWRLLIVDLEN
jgi:hypothetical protein